MDFIAGQCVLGKIRFVDGEMPKYDRTHLLKLIRPAGEVFTCLAMEKHWMQVNWQGLRV